MFNEMNDMFDTVMKLNAEATAIADSSQKLDSAFVGLTLCLKGLGRVYGRKRHISNNASKLFRPSRKNELETLSQRMHSIVAKLINVKTNSAWTLLDRGGVFELIQAAVTTKTAKNGQLQKCRTCYSHDPSCCRHSADFTE